jgi:hypothetical protein
MKVVHLDDIEATRIEGTLWKPIRSTLEIEAFGINAYTAERAGDALFNEHDETEALAGSQRHQELYLVLAGRATFTVDGEQIDAPARTLIFVDDPASRRGAVAAEAPTTVLAIGAPVGEGYRPPPWEKVFLEQRARLTSGRAHRQA